MSTITSTKNIELAETEAIPLRTISYTPETGTCPNWRPWSFRWYFLIVPLVLHTILAAFAVILLQGDSINEIKNLLTFSTDSAGAYAAWQCGPVAVAVFAWIPWGIIYTDVCRLEPFYQLVQPGGTTLQESLSNDHPTTFVLIVFFHALMMRTRKHTAVALTSLIYLLASIVLPIAVAAMFTLDWIDVDGKVLVNINDAAIYCSLVVSVLVIIGAITLFVILSRRQTGLYGDPAGIGGIAALISGSDLLDKFKELRSYDTQARIDEVLGPYRIRLNHAGTDGSLYQICLLDPQEKHDFPHERRFEQTRAEAHSWWLWGRSFLMMWLIAAVPNFIYSQNVLRGSADNVLIGKICATITAVMQTALADNWQLNIALLEPFYRLKATKPLETPDSQSSADLEHIQRTGDVSRSGSLAGSANALNLNFSGSPTWNFLHAVRKAARSGLVAYISFYVLLLQMSVIYAPSRINAQFPKIDTTSDSSGFGDNYSTSYDQDNDVSDYVVDIPHAVIINYYAVLALSFLQVLFWLILLAIVMRRKRRAIMPRRPYTLSSIILYLCNSKGLLEDLKGTSTMSKEERDNYMERIGRKYAFGWIQPENDLKVHVAIERVENVKDPFVYKQKMVENAR